MTTAQLMQHSFRQVQMDKLVKYLQMHHIEVISTCTEKMEIIVNAAYTDCYKGEVIPATIADVKKFIGY